MSSFIRLALKLVAVCRTYMEFGSNPLITFLPLEFLDLLAQGCSLLASGKRSILIVDLWFYTVPGTCADYNVNQHKRPL